MTAAMCGHFVQPGLVVAGSVGCEECERIGAWWLHLRICLTCGHVGCCDDSPNRHATAHVRAACHPVIASFEPSEQWAYCYPDDRFFKRLPPGFEIVRSGG
jgi:uncharacterized UBP type Zn finger protein